MSKIKICGLSRMKDIEYVNIALPDYIGFVFAKSKRQVSIKQAKLLKTKLSKDIMVVGVFVNADIDLILTIINEGIIDIVQLHGDEDNNYINLLKAKKNITVIKSFSKDLINANFSQADYVLFDSITPGSGEKFNWDLIKNINRPFFLAGGINIDNIDEALKKVPYVIDISSGVEDETGFKNKAKIDEIVRRVKNE